MEEETIILNCDVCGNDIEIKGTGDFSKEKITCGDCYENGSI